MRIFLILCLALVGCNRSTPPTKPVVEAPAPKPAAPVMGWDAVPGILARIKAPVFPARDFPVTDFGAKGDGTTDCTDAIRQAIAACNAAGGGRVVVTGGVFLTAPLTTPTGTRPLSSRELIEMGEKNVPVEQRIFGDKGVLRPNFFVPYGPGEKVTGVGRWREDGPGAWCTRAALAREPWPPHSASMRIAIVEDHLMFREVLRKVCTVDLGHKVVGEASDGREAVQVVKATKPGLVLLDLHLPNLDGFGVVEEIRKIAPETRVLVLSSHCDEYTVFRAERARVQGFVDKNTNSVAALKAAITAVVEGRVSFSEAFMRAKATRLRDPQSFDKLLTERERVVLSLIGAPLGDEEIGRRLKIATETVEKHRFNLLKKLELRTTTDLVRYARDHGFTMSAPRSGDDAMLP